MRQFSSTFLSTLAAAAVFGGFHSALFAEDVDKNSPEAEMRSFHLPEGYEINLFASEKDGIVKPVQMRWDAEGRLWVSCIPSYPQPKPDQTPDDRIIVLQDTQDTGHADKSTVFARGMLMPLGLEIGAGGVYATDGNDLVHLSDSTGGLHADRRVPVLRGFFTGDSHQEINSFIWGPGGELMFCQGLHAFSRVETPYGVETLDKAGVWRYRPRTGRLDPFLGNDRGPQNPWGIVFDDWGQPIMTAGNGQGVYYLLPAMIRTDHFLDPRKIDDTRNIKFCGVDIIGTKAMPKDVQGVMVAGSILNNSVYWFKLDEDGSGFHAKDLPPLITSSSVDFRAVDVKVGPDGAIYVADWYNPIIGHYQASLRHPDRDHVHGRIWRITAKGYAAVKQPDLKHETSVQLLDELRSPERWTRYQAKRLLADRNDKEATEAATSWLAQLKPDDAQYEHLLLEAIGVFEAHEVVNIPLLEKLINAKDYRARAYAAGVVAHWQDRLPDALAYLRQLAADASPRVRVAAVVAASYVPNPKAIEAAYIVTDQPRDRFIDEALIQATAALKPQWLPAMEAGSLTFDNHPSRLAALCKVDGSPNVHASLMKLVQSGKLTGDSLHNALIALAGIGDSKQVADILADPRVSAEPAVCANALDAIAERLSRGEKLASNDLREPLTKLSQSNDGSVQRSALVVIGLLHDPTLHTIVEPIARNSKASDDVQQAADESLPEMKWSGAAAVLKDLADAGHGSVRQRAIAVAALTKVDVASAAYYGAGLLEEADGAAEAPRIIPAFLARQGGADALADAIEKLKSFEKDQAKLTLRALTAAGGQSGKLWEIVSKAAGNSGAKLEYDAKLVQALATEAREKGDPAAGERVFRSSVTNCFACHSIGGGGGRTGPDLAPVGTALPIDLVVESVLWPQRQIKEGYTATMVQTTDGDVVQGYHVSDDKNEYVLRDPPTGKFIHIPAARIKAKRDVGSLMPDGITDGLTHKELVDLVRFLSELGKPGPYRVPTAPIVRVWETAAIYGGASPRWTTRYAQTDGNLPLDEIAPDNGIVSVQCTIDVTKDGVFMIKPSFAGNLSVTIDGKAASEVSRVEWNVGKHVIEFTIAGDARKASALKVEVSPAAGSNGECRDAGMNR